MCWRTEDDDGPTVRLPCHRHFVGFFNVPVKAPTPANFFTVIPRNRPISVDFYDAHRNTEDLFSSNTPSVPTAEIQYVLSNLSLKLLN